MKISPGRHQLWRKPGSVISDDILADVLDKKGGDSSDEEEKEQLQVEEMKIPSSSEWASSKVEGQSSKSGVVFRPLNVPEEFVNLNTQNSAI